MADRQREAAAAARSDSLWRRGKALGVLGGVGGACGFLHLLTGGEVGETEINEQSSSKAEVEAEGSWRPLHSAADRGSTIPFGSGTLGGRLRPSPRLRLRSDTAARPQTPKRSGEKGFGLNRKLHPASDGTQEGGGGHVTRVSSSALVFSRGGERRCGELCFKVTDI